MERVSYVDFLQELDDWRGRLRHERRTGLPNPSQPTYCRLWRTFCRRHQLVRPTPRQVLRYLLRGLAEGVWDRSSPPKEVLPEVCRYLASRKVVPPGPATLVQLLWKARGHARRRDLKERTDHLSRILGTSLSDLPLTQRYRAVRNFPRFPPAARGKPDDRKLVEEDGYRRQIARILDENHLSLERLLSVPDRERLVAFLERNATSTLRRREVELVIQSLPFYLANRWQEALDMVLSVFVLLCRSTWERIEVRYGQEVADSSRAFFERHEREFAPFQRAFLSALEGQTPGRLHSFRPLVRELRHQGEAVGSSEGFYALLARHAFRLRKLSLRLKGISFLGKDPRARAVVQALAEVLRFAPLTEPVPSRARRLLSFLPVPDRQLASRRVFEGVLLDTLAHMLASGRITCPLSRSFGNRWEKVGASRENGITEATALADRAERELDEAWRNLRERGSSVDWIERGHLVSRRPSRKVREEELKLREKAKRRLLSKVIREVPVMDLLLEVHRSTRMLDAFQPSQGARHRLTEEGRIGRVIPVIVGRATGMGLVRMARPSRRRAGFTIGQLVNLDEGYVTAPALRKALGLLADAHEKRALGRAWGTGDRAAADGRTVQTTERSLQAGYHRRHRRTGVTLYWVVRDDWWALKLAVIGAHDFEAWHLVDGVLQPDGGDGVRLVAGDTHGQQLAVWGLCHLLGIELAARFHSLGRVKLFANRSERGLPVEGVETVRWSVVRRSLVSLARMVEAIRARQLTAEEALRRGNVYDEEGQNVMEALRELGKAVRTRWVLRFAMSEELRREVQLLCNRAETFNDFQAAVSFGHVGSLRVMDPGRREVNALCIELVMNSIIFYNEEKYGPKIRKVPGATPVMWEHVLFYEPYRFTWRGPADEKPRPL